MSDYPQEMPSPEEIDKLTDKIRKRLRGKGPLLQGAALADIVAMFFAGHHPNIRETVIENWIETVRKLTAINEKEILEHYGIKGWDVPLN